MADNIYCYPDSDVLKNKLNIQNKEQLRKVERQLITHCILLDCSSGPASGSWAWCILTIRDGF